jgi:hypothetical protein
MSFVGSSSWETLIEFLFVKLLDCIKVWFYCCFFIINEDLYKHWKLKEFCEKWYKSNYVLNV